MKISKDAKQIALNLLKKKFPDKKIKTMKPLHAGYTNFSYFVILSDNSHWQVRIPHDNNIINRKTEAGVLKLIGNKEFEYFDDKTGIAIKKWTTARTPGYFTVRNKEFNEKLLRQIKDIHAVKVPSKLPIKSLNFDTYNENLYRLRFIYQKKFLCILDRHRDDKLVLNHTDINPKNILYTKDKRVVLIDFEWAALANDYWDYANYVRESGINYRNIEWEKYINNFELKKFQEVLYVSCVYAYLWTYAMPQTPKIIAYRKRTYKQIKKYYHGVVNLEHDIIKPL